jgi:hypothetical protein
MITFNQNVDLTIFESEDREIMESFKVNEPVNAKVIESSQSEHRGIKYVDIQFENGNVALGIDVNCFNVIN